MFTTRLESIKNLLESGSSYPIFYDVDFLALDWETSQLTDPDAQVGTQLLYDSELKDLNRTNV